MYVIIAPPQHKIMLLLIQPFHFYLKRYVEIAVIDGGKEAEFLFERDSVR
jgi:hypothetical protein